MEFFKEWSDIKRNIVAFDINSNFAMQIIPQNTPTKRYYVENKKTTSHVQISSILPHLYIHLSLGFK